jgi:hypothetical protein
LPSIAMELFTFVLNLYAATVKLSTIA